jgi:hypothetical protein
MALQRTTATLEWIKPKRLEVFGTIDPNDPLRRAIREHGLPRVLGVSPEQEALLLLEFAAEVEHSLMVQYLYASYSVSAPTSASFLISGVAVEEMGHLATVQNLRIALGGDIYLGRQDRSPQPDVDPIPFVREPLTLGSLAKYVSAEAPILPHGDPREQKLAQIHQMATEVGGSNISRVGLLYAILYWLFQPTDEPTGAWKLNIADGFPAGHHVGHFSDPELRMRQVSAEAWGASSNILIDFVTNPDEALTAIHRIAEQGEGFEEGEASHFSRFFDLFQSLESGSLMVHAVPTDPTVGEVGNPNPNAITSPKAATWATLMNVRYEILLLCLAQAFRPSHAIDSTLGPLLIEWAREEMHRFRSNATVLRGLDRTEVPGPKASMPFELPHSDFPDDDPGRWGRFKELIVLSGGLIEKLRGMPLATVEPTRLNQMESDDLQRNPVLDGLLA